MYLSHMSVWYIYLHIFNKIKIIFLNLLWLFVIFQTLVHIVYIFLYNMLNCCKYSIIGILSEKPHIIFLIIYSFLERGRGENERKRYINVREQHRSVVSWIQPDQEPNPQPRHVPWPEIELAVFHSVKGHPAHWATPIRAQLHIIEWSLWYRG